MSNNRKNFSPAQNISLITQVNCICPLCSNNLFHTKKGKNYKNYQLAHIYPLNPTSEEEQLLKDEKRLSEDVNNEDNIIPLCLNCHGKFDKPRTLEEYKKLYSIKTDLIKQSKQRDLWAQYPIEDQIIQVIDCLYSEEITDILSEITYDIKDAIDKFNVTITSPTKRKIQNNINDYFQFIRKKFAALEAESPNSSFLISTQIKAYYQKQKTLGLTQQEIFNNISDWLYIKTKPKSKESTEIIASFFIQNCEVFE